MKKLKEREKLVWMGGGAYEKSSAAEKKRRKEKIKKWKITFECTSRD